MVNGNEWPSSQHRCFPREPCPRVPNTYCAPKTSMLPAGHMRTKIKRIAYNVEHMHLEETAFWVGEGYGYLDVRDLHGRHMDPNRPPWRRAAHCTPGSIFPVHLWLDRNEYCGISLRTASLIYVYLLRPAIWRYRPGFPLPWSPPRAGEACLEALSSCRCPKVHLPATCGQWHASRRRTRVLGNSSCG